MAAKNCTAIIVGGVEKRGDVHITHILVKGEEQIKTLVIPQSVDVTRCTNGAFVMLLGISTSGEGYRMSATGMVLETRPFTYKASLVQDFLQPKVFTIPEIMESPVKTRVCVGGTVEDVSDILETPKSKRRVITLADGQEKLIIKIWGDMAEKINPMVGSSVLMKNLVVARYNQNPKDCNSKNETSVGDWGEERAICGTMDAGVCNGEKSTVVMDGNVFRLTKDIFVNIFNGESFTPDINAEVLVKGNRIVHVTSAAKAPSEPPTKRQKTNDK